MNVVYKIHLETANRGIKLYTISGNKGKLFAHEIGDEDRVSKLFGWGQLLAHRINPERRHGNQYRTTWIPKPFKTIAEAISACINYAKKDIQYV